MARPEVVFVMNIGEKLSKVFFAFVHNFDVNIGRAALG
jgi:hypothetical protein